MEPDTQYLSSNSPPGDLRGARGRLITGRVNIACGIADAVIAIIIRAVQPSHTGILTRVDEGVVEGVAFETLILGISYAILAITAGCFGIFSRRGQCQTVTYLVLCVVLAIFTAVGTINSASHTADIRTIHADEGYRLESYVGTIFFFLIFNTIANALHCVVAIVGASFTCGAVCCIPDTRGQQQPMSVQPVVLQPLPQQPMGVAGATTPPAYTNPAMK